MSETNGKEPTVLLAVILKSNGKMEWKSELDVFRLNMLLDEMKVEVIQTAKNQASQPAAPELVKEVAEEKGNRTDVY